MKFFGIFWTFKYETVEFEQLFAEKVQHGREGNVLSRSV
jgi:hypothetical protein